MRLIMQEKDHVVHKIGKISWFTSGSFVLESTVIQMPTNKYFNYQGHLQQLGIPNYSNKDIVTILNLFGMCVVKVVELWWPEMKRLCSICLLMHRILSVLICIKISLFVHFQYKDLFASDSFVSISKEGSINFAYLPNIGII